MSRSTFRTAAAACLAALSIAAVPALAHAADDDSDPSPGQSCTTVDGEVLEDGEVHYEFQGNGSVLELQCNDGTLCGTMFLTDYPGLPQRYACESWGATLEHRSESGGARVLGVLVTTAADTYRIRPVRVVSRTRLVAVR